MYKQRLASWLVHHWRNISLIWFSNIMIGCVIIGVAQMLLGKEATFALDTEMNSLTPLTIFCHNVSVSLLYYIPYFGVFVYVFAFIIIYALIGTYIYTYGYMAAFGHLWHLPLEVLALSIPVYVCSYYKKLAWRETIVFIAVSFVLLFCSACIEFFFSKGV